VRTYRDLALLGGVMAMAVVWWIGAIAVVVWIGQLH